jgi:hypothetical protein
LSDLGGDMMRMKVEILTDGLVIFSIGQIFKKTSFDSLSLVSLSKPL